MKISEILASGRTSISFEVFPPKNECGYETVSEAVSKIAMLKPDFMSVTYGAGGGTSEFTVSVAASIQRDFGVPALAHISCISSSRENVMKQVKLMRESGIENVLALRGDIPAGGEINGEYRYASELASDLSACGDFCIGGACYPEGHPESASSEEDIANVKRKVEAGCEFLTTQMFFDNNILYNYLYKIRERGITVPVLAGIMPVTNGKQVKRICQLSGTYLPARFRAIVDKFGSDPHAMTQAGVAYATEQIIDLIANGVHGIHVYSMNKPEVAEAIMRNLSSIIGRY